jgi:hypothetical protein
VLLEVGASSLNYQSERWAIEFSADGNEILFITEGAGVRRVHVRAKISMTAGHWRNLCLTYDSYYCRVYMGSILLFNLAASVDHGISDGTGVTTFPGRPTRNSVSINNANGQLDVLETFNYPLPASLVGDLTLSYSTEYYQIEDQGAIVFRNTPFRQEPFTQGQSSRYYFTYPYREGSYIHRIRIMSSGKSEELRQIVTLKSLSQIEYSFTGIGNTPASGLILASKDHALNGGLGVIEFLAQVTADLNLAAPNAVSTSRDFGDSYPVSIDFPKQRINVIPRSLLTHWRFDGRAESDSGDSFGVIEPPISPNYGVSPFGRGLLVDLANSAPCYDIFRNDGSVAAC